MSDQRWAARYTFCDALWRGRARVVADPELEALLVESDRQGALGDAAPPVLELVEALLPRARGVPVWMIVGSDEIARRLAPSRPGVRFVAATAAADVFARHPWEVALVALRTSTDEMFTDVGGYAVTTIDEGPGRAFGRHAAGWMSAIADAVGLGRSAVLAVDADDAAYDALVESAAAYFSAARIYAMYAPAMLAFVELDDAQEDDDGNGFDGHDISAVPTYNRIEGAPADRWDVDDGGEAEADDEDDEDAVPLSFDNTLGAAEPRFLGYLAIASGDEAPDGLTLVEVTGSVGGDDDQDNGLRHQLASARRQADLVAIERQRLVEHIDAVEADNAALREAVAQLRDQLAGTLEPDGGERLDEALAREQSLRWRVAALERELEALRVRPVAELEADLAAARARLVALADAEGAQADRVAADTDSETVSDAVSNGARRIGTDDARRLPAMRAAASGRTAALRAVEGLVRRIDRGAIGTIDLRRELSALRRRLRG
jgi:hypothetical protein